MSFSHGVKTSPRFRMICNFKMDVLFCDFEVWWIQCLKWYFHNGTKLANIPPRLSWHSIIDNIKQFVSKYIQTWKDFIGSSKTKNERMCQVWPDELNVLKSLLVLQTFSIAYLCFFHQKISFPTLYDEEHLFDAERIHITPYLERFIPRVRAKFTIITLQGNVLVIVWWHYAFSVCY